MHQRKNFSLILAISIPVVLILSLVLYLFLPRWFSAPAKYNFIYSVGDYYNYAVEYRVHDGKLAKYNLESPEKGPAKARLTPVHLYLHDVAANSSREVSFEEAKDWKLISGNISPDGFEVVRSAGSGGIFGALVGVGDTDYNSLFLKGMHTTKKLNLPVWGVNAYNFHFLGWIENHAN